jgi:hypothetical protein
MPLQLAAAAAPAPTPSPHLQPPGSPAPEEPDPAPLPPPSSSLSKRGATEMLGVIGSAPQSKRSRPACSTPAEIGEPRAAPAFGEPLLPAFQATPAPQHTSVTNRHAPAAAAAAAVLRNAQQPRFSPAATGAQPSAMPHAAARVGKQLAAGPPPSSNASGLFGAASSLAKPPSSPISSQPLAPSAPSHLPVRGPTDVRRGRSFFFQRAADVLECPHATLMGSTAEIESLVSKVGQMSEGNRQNTLEWLITRL